MRSPPRHIVLCFAFLGCSGGDRPGPVPSTEQEWFITDNDKLGSEIAIGSDGSIYVVGGQDPRPFDLSLLYKNKWLAKFSSNAELIWERIVNGEINTTSIGRSLSLAAGDYPVFLGTTFDGEDTPTVYRYSTDGEAEDPFTFDAGATVVRVTANGQLVMAGSKLLEWRNGRPFTALWVGALSEQELSWQQQMLGVQGSVSTAWDLATDGQRYYVAGSKGNAADSNASDPWLASGTIGNDMDWEKLPALGGGNGRASFVSPIHGGSVLVAGHGDSSFVSRYSEGGEEEWKVEPDFQIHALEAAKDGYLVATSKPQVEFGQRSSVTLRYLNWKGLAFWHQEITECEAISDLAIHENSVIALLVCGEGFGLASFRLDAD